MTTLQLFVVEQYDEAGPGGLGDGPRATPPPALPGLACAVHVPTDDVVLALVEGTDEQAVCDALATVGWRVDRITRAVWAGPDLPTPRRR